MTRLSLWMFVGLFISASSPFAISAVTFPNQSLMFPVTPIGSKISNSIEVHFSMPDACNSSGTGAGGMFIASASISGTNAADFIVKVSCFAQTSGNIDITFSPSSLGGRSAQLNIVLAGLSGVPPSIKAYSLFGEGTSSIPGYSSFSQVVSGGGWQTEVTLSNLSNSLLLKGRVQFFDGAGKPLGLRLSTSLNPAGTVTSSLDISISRLSELVITINDDSLTQPEVGWASVQAADPSIIGGFPLPFLDGHAVFRYKSPGAPDLEGVVPISQQSYFPFAMPYDNTRGFRTAVAVANECQVPVFIVVSAFDERGISLASGVKMFQLSANGHEAAFLDDEFPGVLSNQRGIVEFAAVPYGCNINGIGLRFNPTGSFTSIPIIRSLN